MYELFYSPGACSRAVHVLLNEIDTDFKLTKADIGSGKDEKLKAVNPRGQVPTLVINGEAMAEGGAIMSWLADTHNSPLLPKTGMERARALQWLAFANSSMHPPFGSFFGNKKKLGDAYLKSDEYTRTFETLQKLWNVVETQLSKNKYLAGDEITLGDILLAVMADWVMALPTKLNLGEKTKAWKKDVQSRPSWKKAVDAEQAPQQSAA